MRGSFQSGLLLCGLMMGCSAQKASGPQAAGAWGPGVRDWAERSFRNSFPDGSASTVWASIQNQKYLHDPAWSQTAVRRGTVTLRVPNEHFAKRVIETELFLQAKDGVDPQAWDHFSVPHGCQPAKLIVILPGVFNSATDAQSVRYLHDFANRGYHVLILPNPLSLPYINSRPLARPGDLAHEADAALATIRYVKTLLGPDAVTGVQLVGFSYGGVLAAATTARDYETGGHVLTGVSTSVSPPFNLRISQKAIDDLIHEHLSDRGSILNRLYEIGINYSLARAQEELPTSGWASALAATGVVAIAGFQDQLSKSARAYAHILAQLFRFASDIDFDQFEKDIIGSGSEHFPESDPQLLANEQEMELRSAYTEWAQRAPMGGLRLIAAHDDLINPQVLNGHDSFDEALPTSDLIFLPSGGHLGFTALDWYQSFLDQAFSKSVPPRPLLKQSDDAETARKLASPESPLLLPKI